MVTKSNVHAARTSPIPGVVVIVLAVAAIVFGVAFVRKPKVDSEALAQEVARMQATLADEVKLRTRLERRLSDRAQELDELSSALSELRFESDAAHGPEVATPASEAAEERALQAQRAAQLAEDQETRAEIEALQRRAMDVEAELREVRSALAARVAEAGDLTVGSVPLPVEVVTVTVTPEDEAGETPEQLAGGSFQVARVAAERHASLLAPFFEAGHVQPGGARTAEAGPVSLSALVAAGALDAPTAEALEENTGLRSLADFASNTPNDRTLWPYSRGSRTRVWYLRGDGRESVPLAQTLLREHGEAFVALGLLAP